MGEIRVILGPMFSGKTSRLFDECERYFHAHKKCAILRRDSRDGNTSGLTTHGGFYHDKIAITFTDSLCNSEAAKVFLANDVIGIDEVQFFAADSLAARDVVFALDKWAERGKVIICAGLDSDWQRAPFAITSYLVAIADSVCKLRAICVQCGADAPFSARTSNNMNNYINPVGGAEKYCALCRKCYNMLPAQQ